MTLSNKNILLTGGAGFLGSFVHEKLVSAGADPTRITIPRSSTCDLRTWDACKEITEKQHVVIHLAATVGGIGFNKKYPATLFYDNLMMGTQLMEAARQANVEKFVALGTICAYPKHATVPFKEEEIWDGYPEETNAAYGLAKKMMLVQAQTYRTQYGMNAIYLLPVNLYGPRDMFDPERSHVIPAIIKKIDDAQKAGSTSIEVWGTGNATREFLYVEDAAEAIVQATLLYDGNEPVNIGAGEEISIKDLALLIAELMEFKGELHWQSDKPDGQPRRKLDTSRARDYFGFSARTSLRDGLGKTISWYRSHN